MAHFKRYSKQSNPRLMKAIPRLLAPDEGMFTSLEPESRSAVFSRSRSTLLAPCKMLCR